MSDIDSNSRRWHPMSTAPKDRPIILLCPWIHPHRVALGWWRRMGLPGWTICVGTYKFQQKGDRALPVGWTDLPEFPTDEQLSSILEAASS